MYQVMRSNEKNETASQEDDNGNPNNDYQEDHQNLASPISDTIINSTKQFNSYDHQALLEQCNLQTYLNHYRNKADIKLFDEDMEQSQVQPPDILFFKGYEAESSDGKPDLIQNVVENDERNSLPPNIVGDFEKEIEKEIVEIVSGYKDIFGDRTQELHTTTPVKPEEEEPQLIKHHPITEKIHDAKLSNGREVITPSLDVKYIKLPKYVETNDEMLRTSSKYNNNYYAAAPATTTTTLKQRYEANLTSNNNNNVNDFLPEKQQTHHYNCNFFNAISNKKTRNSSFFKTKEWNTSKTVTKGNLHYLI